MDRVVIVGGGPGGYEAALVAAQLGASVTLVDSDGIGGSAVLTDCVPSKALLAVADVATELRRGPQLGLAAATGTPDLAAINNRIRALALAQSADTAQRCRTAGVQVVVGRGSLAGPNSVLVDDGSSQVTIPADVILLATGARPRTLEQAMPDGARILTWEQVYALEEVPPRLLVVGSGVTGVEFAFAFNALGSDVVLISSRDHVLPSEDPDAARVLEEVFTGRGMTVLRRSRATSAHVTAGGEVVLGLADGQELRGTHALIAVGSLPNTIDLGLERVGVATDDRGFVTVDRVSRTSVRGIYAAGDATGVAMLASVAAMQGRIAMWHALGAAVTPLDLRTVSSNVFTDPQVATVGYTQADVDAGRVNADVMVLPLATNARAKMIGATDGFVKILCRRGTRIVVGAVIVAPHASELIHALALAVEHRHTVDQVAATFTVYPSLSGSVAEAARHLRLG